MLLLTACGEEGGDNVEMTDPSDLVVDVEVSTDGSGLVSLEASAINAEGFQFDMGDASEVIFNTSGQVIDYKYETTGIYAVEVRAIGKTGRYVKKEMSLSVQVGDSGPVTLEDGYATPISYDGMSLVWSDEFNGSSLNTDDWTHEIGNGCPGLCGWGNNELEYYRSENTWIEDGALVIEARKENFQSNNYTSSRIITKGKKSFQYGRVDIRALLPKGQGIWPALWMLGDNIDAVGWPACGEIDVMELIGGTPNGDNTSYGTVHWDSGGHAEHGGSYTLSSGIFNNEYHVFSIIWDSSAIKWYVDDEQYQTIDITPATLSEFHEKFFFIFNVAVGGTWPGNPDGSTVFPQQMKVDYIRVFQAN
ncbi:glycoside hydrolase family 16 protein [Marinoscillum sp. MHG1-6]|uniref:glycoside hydrolase family 16 protein n=1 Tax=Marinoscillum sp. MHG1-6 TaxID=2959627 RepID=UPI002157B568|nr:glycoside hydrolase family 16 protein [Marinoscillum sp. MHG1-6]